jgi:hypothetical protein
VQISDVQMKNDNKNAIHAIRIKKRRHPLKGNDAPENN